MEVSSTVSCMLQGNVTLLLFDLQFACTDRLFAYPSVRFAAQHHDFSSSPRPTVSPMGPQSCAEHMKPQSGQKVLAWSRAVSCRWGLGAPHDGLQTSVAGLPPVWAPACQTRSWLGLDAALPRAPTEHTWRSERAHHIIES